MTLDAYLRLSAAAHPERPAVEDASGEPLPYAELDQLSDRLRDRLVALGVRPGDRVGLYLHKSADAVACIFGILKAGAAYVPVDPTAPASRNAYIHVDCTVRVCLVESCFETDYVTELGKLGAAPHTIVLDGTGAGEPLRIALDRLDASGCAPAAAAPAISPDDLAYILYTSGSTGKPKGVMLSHRNAAAFVDWCSREFAPRPEDRFSSHAPFHFDLSILDIYLSLKHGAALVIVPEDVGKDPVRLSDLIAARQISVWYSAPSILSLLAQSGHLKKYDYSRLRIVFFAGEVFPVANLRLLQQQWPHPRYYNLYGPTETNVCTWYEIPPSVPTDRVDPYPIGRTCDHLAGRVVDAGGADVPRGDEGELCIAGDNVMQGYWNLPDLTARAFFLDDHGRRWYRTGDVVVEPPDGNYIFRGRRDRMIKKRGYRVELGEIEACLYRHPQVREAAVIALPDDTLGMKVIAHLTGRDDKKFSIIDLKRFCAQHLPVYMVPDLFRFHEQLPKTSTDKTDYQKLRDAT